jgi:hypothetical protein
MIIVDANTGQQVKEGDSFTNVDGHHVVCAVRSGIFSASILMSTVPRGANMPLPPQWRPLTVRWTHPRFFGRHVGFINS